GECDRISEVAKQEVARLHGNGQLGSGLRTDIYHCLRPGWTAIGGVGGENIVVGGVEKALSSVSVELDVQVIKALGICRRGDPEQNAGCNENSLQLSLPCAGRIGGRLQTPYRRGGGAR